MTTEEEFIESWRQFYLDRGAKAIEITPTDEGGWLVTADYGGDSPPESRRERRRRLGLRWWQREGKRP